MASSPSTVTRPPQPSLSPFLSFSSLRRRLPLLATFCILAFALSNLCSSLYSSLPQAGSQFGGQSRVRRMEGSSTTVPSIVVYVTVPNKEAGKKLAESIIKEKLAACVNRIPGIESVYQWNGEDSDSADFMKCRRALFVYYNLH